jgi:hypothetical protein
MKPFLLLSVLLLAGAQTACAEIIYGETGLFALGGGSTVTRAPESPSSQAGIAVCPNPFNPSTAITIALQGKISVSIYTAAGKLVRQFSVKGTGDQKARVVWNGTDRTGAAVVSGIYFVRAVSGGRSITTSMILMR